jgi:hypothetical protein
LQRFDEAAADPEVYRARMARVDRLIDEALDDRQTFLQVMSSRSVSRVSLHHFTVRMRCVVVHGAE